MFSRVYDYKLDFTPDVSLCKTTTIANETVIVEITTQFDSNRKWALFINGVFEESSTNHTKYADLMLNNITDDQQDILIVGGGDLLLAQAVNQFASSITVVDPLTIIIQRMLGLIEKQSDLTQFMSLTINEELFSEFINNQPHEQYDCVFVDISEDTMEATKEIYCIDFFNQLKTILKEKGFVHMYFGFNPHDYNNIVGFDHIHTEKKFIESYCDNGYCVTLQKR